MNDKYSYNPFGDADLRLTQPLPEIYDKDSNIEPNINRTTVKFDTIEEFKPFSDVNITSESEFGRQGPSAGVTSHLELWERDLEAKSQKLSEEEERQQIREANLNKTANFPPFPQCCRIKPCFYQDIDIEIPERYRRIVKFAYALWICYCVALLLNVFGSLVVLITFSSAPGLSSSTPTLFGVSILLFILFVPLSYLMWFRRLYIAFKTDSSLQFFMFFIVFSLCIVSLVVEMIGIPQCGVCGWILVVMTKDKLGVMCLVIVIAVAFTVLTMASIYLLLKVNSYFRSSGGSFSQAKQEIATSSTQSNAFKSVVFDTITSRR